MSENAKKYMLMFFIGFAANFAATMLVIHIANRNQQNNTQLAQKTAAQPPRQVTQTTVVEDEGTNA